MQGSPPPLLRWQPADLRGWLFGVALCTRRRRPHCVKEKRREAILVLVLSPTEALRKRTEAPHGFAWMGKRLVYFSVSELRHQQKNSKGMAQRNRKWPNRVTGSLAKMEVKPRQKQWMGIGRTQTASSFLCTSCTLCPPPWQNKPPPPWHFVFSEDLTAPPPTAAQRCTSMFKDVQSCS